MLRLCAYVFACVSVHGVCVLTLLSKVSPQENLAAQVAHHNLIKICLFNFNYTFSPKL